MEVYDPKRPVYVGMSIIGGVGLTLMTIALGVGVVQGAAANGSVIAALFWTGVVLLVGATGAWFGIAQPYKHFDDINQPQYHGHEHHDEH